jgi:hypothetical protein
MVHLALTMCATAPASAATGIASVETHFETRLLGIQGGLDVAVSSTDGAPSMRIGCPVGRRAAD